MRSPGFVHGLVELLHSSYLSFLERRTEKKIVKLRQKLKDATPAQSSAAAATAAAAAKSTANNTNATKMSWRARFTSPLTKNPHAYPNGPIWQKVRQVARAKGGHDINLGLDPKARRNVAIIGGGLAIAYSAFTSRLYALPYESWWRPGKTESFRVSAEGKALPLVNVRRAVLLSSLFLVCRLCRPSSSGSSRVLPQPLPHVEGGSMT